MSTRTRHLTSPLGTVVLEAFASRLSFGIVGFALPLYAHHLGMSFAAIGVLLSTNLAVAVILKPAMGVVVDRVGVRHAYVGAVAMRTLALLLLLVAATPAHLFAVRGLHGAAAALRDPAAASVLAGLGGKQSVARRFAWYQTAKTVAGSLGRFAGGVLITVLAGYRGAFAVAAVLSLLPLILVLWRLTGAALAPLTVPPSFVAPAQAGPAWRRVGPFAILGFLVAGTANLMTNLLPVLAVEYAGLNEAAAGGIYLVTAVVSLSGPFWGWLADRGGQRWVLGMRAIGNIVSSVIWLVSPTYAGLVAGKAADDVGKAAFRPAWGAAMAEVAADDPRRRAATLAQLSAAEDLGEMSGPVVAGLIWSLWGIPTLLVVRIGLAVFTEGYALSLHRRTRAVEVPVAVPEPQHTR
ncbi:MAG: MFS transporter [Sporichthyaceae bacterium]